MKELNNCLVLGCCCSCYLLPSCVLYHTTTTLVRSVLPVDLAWYVGTVVDRLYLYVERQVCLKVTCFVTMSQRTTTTGSL